MRCRAPSAWPEPASGLEMSVLRPRAFRRRWLVPCGLALVLGAAHARAADGAACPASPEVRRLHATPVLTAGARPWAMGPLPAKPPPAPALVLPAPHSEARRHLLRRLTFVLTGMPPREDDAAAFLADPSAQVLGRTLDRLLAAPATPQRLAEVWLRATGHVDRWPSAPGPARLQPAEAWRYRDWVVTSLRTTPNVRRLARLTLAGDSQTDSAAGGPDASGMLATLWHVTAAQVSADFEETVVEWSARQAERTAGAFLGLDLSCARCHDHPALPLPSEEAAGLVAIFAHTRAFVRGPDGAPAINQELVAPSAARQKRARALKTIAGEEARLEAQRGEFALLAAAEFLPQTAEYVRAAWTWHRQPTGTLSAFTAPRGLLEEPLKRWLSALGLDGDPPAHSLAAPWWAEWTTAREAGTPEAVAAAARLVQDSHQADLQSPFFSTSPAMDAFFTLDQQTQLARQVQKIAALRRKLPDAPQIPSLAEGSPPGMDPPALAPSLPSLLTGGASPTPITPPGGGRRTLATWLEGDGAAFFARLVAVRLAEGLGHPMLPAPSALRLWTAQEPPEAAAIDEVAACLLAGGWPLAAQRILMLQANGPTRPTLRLGATEWRDALLFVTGTLDAQQGGPPDPARDSRRRSLYREWAPFPTVPTEDFLQAQASALAALARRKAGTDPLVQLNFLTHRLFQRPPTPAEREAPTATPEALRALCAQLLASEEFRALP